MSRSESVSCRHKTSIGVSPVFLRRRTPDCSFQSASRDYGVAERRRRSDLPSYCFVTTKTAQNDIFFVENHPNRVIFTKTVATLQIAINRIHPHKHWLKRTSARGLRKTRSTSAALFCVRIGEDKPTLHQRFFPIQHHSVQINEGLRIHKHSYIAIHKYTVAIARL